MLGTRGIVRAAIAAASQGGILGGSLTALAPDFDRAVLGVRGMNYSTLLRRSVNFDLYAKGEFGGAVCGELPDELDPFCDSGHPGRPLRQLPEPARAAADPDALGSRRGERLRAPHDHGPAEPLRRNGFRRPLPG